MVSLPERLTASASTSDHHPMPMHATRTGSPAISFGLSSCFRTLHKGELSSQLLPARADRLHRCARNLLIRRPVAARHPDAADALAADEHWRAAFHRGPALR